MTTSKQWSAEVVETLLAAQAIALAPGRAERLARAYQALLEASAADPLLARLEFDAVPTGFALAMQKCR
ncbi:MAG TPA: hypothetical protein VNU96_04615 [Burkholderiales bacterium]|nr:hypothetical protein [Burkholderiales bacterium]